MSLITCCPACGTMFRVVPDQLRLSEGWVRCGHCAEVFDATAHLTDESSIATAAGGDSQSVSEEPLTGASAPRAAASGPSRSDAKDQAPAPARSAIAHEPPLGLDSQGLEESPLDRPFVFRRSELGVAEEAPTPHAAALPSEESAAEDAEAVADVSFMRKARRDAFWHSALVRSVLALLALALTALLALQFAVHERDRLAAADPALRPWLQRLCEPLNCRIQPPRQIEAIVIDSSTFNKLGSDAYRLSFTLRNNAPIALAFPSMELTLTDLQDQAVVRRVLTPAELRATSPVIGPKAEWSASLGIGVAAEADGGRIAGYRLLAFYP